MIDKIDGDLKEVLAEARAIYFAMTHGAITSQQAIVRTRPYLQKLNSAIGLIAKKHNQKPKYISFNNLGENI